MSAQPADVLAADPPAFSADEAAAVARSTYGLVGTARPLVSERDQNFAISAADGSSWVLKISNAAEDRGVVEMEVAAVARIAAVDPELPVPTARATLDGEPIASIETDRGVHLVRLLPLLPGRNPRPDELSARNVRDIGELVARLARAVRSFFHPAAGRVISWDQQHLPGLFQHAELITDPSRRSLLDRVISRSRSMWSRPSRRCGRRSSTTT